MTAIERHNYLLEQNTIKNVRPEPPKPTYHKKAIPKIGTAIPRQTMVTIYSLRKSGKLAELLRMFE